MSINIIKTINMIKNFINPLLATQVVTLEMLDYLCPVSRKVFGKADAYRDLLNRACEQKHGEMTIKGTRLVIAPGQVVLSNSELAKAWGWHRDTTKAFLEHLAEVGVLSFECHQKFFVFTIPSIAKVITENPVQVGSQEVSPDSHPDKGATAQPSASAAERFAPQVRSNADKSDATMPVATGSSTQTGSQHFSKPNEKATAYQQQQSLFGGFESEENSGSAQLPGSVEPENPKP